MYSSSSSSSSSTPSATEYTSPYDYPVPVRFPVRTTGLPAEIASHYKMDRPVIDDITKIAFSDEEDEDNNDDIEGSCAAWYLMEFKFGKYIGEDLSTMITSRKKRNYLRWVKNTSWLHKWQKNYITEALAHYERQKTRTNRVRIAKK